MLIATDCRSENVGVLAVIVSELKLRNIERQIFAADLVIATDDTALNQRPEVLNCVGMDRTDYVLHPNSTDWGDIPMARRPKPIHQLSAADFERMFPDEAACCAYLVGRRWPKVKSGIIVNASWRSSFVPRILASCSTSTTRATATSCFSTPAGSAVKALFQSGSDRFIARAARTVG